MKIKVSHTLRKLYKEVAFGKIQKTDLTCIASDEFDARSYEDLNPLGKAYKVYEKVQNMFGGELVQDKIIRTANGFKTREAELAQEAQDKINSHVGSLQRK